MCWSASGAQFANRKTRINALKIKFKGGPCIGLQLDMWTDTKTHTAYACLTMTSVTEPKNTTGKKVAFGLLSEILDFNVFPFTRKTGANIKAWMLGVLVAHGIDHRMVSGITPDGASDGQCGLADIQDLAETVDTCFLHNLQRGVLFSIGLAGASCKNVEFKALLRKHGRVVMLSNQSLAVTKSINTAQDNAGVPDYKLLGLVKTATTRWGNQYEQIDRNCVLRPAIDPAVEEFKRANKGEKEAIVEPNESDQGSKTGVPVPASDLGLEFKDWDNSCEALAFLEYPYTIKEAIEHKGYATGAQGLVMLHNLMENHCDKDEPLNVKPLPKTCSLADRDRLPLVVKEQKEVDAIIDLARAELKEQLQTRFFTNRPSNARMVQMYMTKQPGAEGVFTREQRELSKTLYLQWLRKAHAAEPRPTRETSPRKVLVTELSRGERIMEHTMPCNAMCYVAE